MSDPRISIDAKCMDGVPCIRGLRIPVSTVVSMVADGMSFADILESYPDLEEEDVRAALRFAARVVESQPVGPNEG